MPLRLNVGLQQKVGLPDFGSLGASCQVELELDSQLLDRSPDALQAEIARAFDACRQAVQTELARSKPAGTNGPPKANRQDGQQTGQTRRATASQVRALKAISGRQKFDLSADLQQRFGVVRPEDLDLKQASRLIDELNRPTNGSRA